MDLLQSLYKGMDSFNTGRITNVRAKRLDWIQVWIFGDFLFYLNCTIEMGKITKVGNRKWRL